MGLGWDCDGFPRWKVRPLSPDTQLASKRLLCLPPLHSGTWAPSCHLQTSLKNFHPPACPRPGLGVIGVLEGLGLGVWPLGRSGLETSSKPTAGGHWASSPHVYGPLGMGFLKGSTVFLFLDKCKHLHMRFSLFVSLKLNNKLCNF